MDLIQTADKMSAIVAFLFEFFSIPPPFIRYLVFIAIISLTNKILALPSMRLDEKTALAYDSETIAIRILSNTMVTPKVYKTKRTTMPEWAWRNSMSTSPSIRVYAFRYESKEKKPVADEPAALSWP